MKKRVVLLSFMSQMEMQLKYGVTTRPMMATYKYQIESKARVIMSNKRDISFGNEEESAYIRKRLIEFNAKHVPEYLSSRYEEITLTLKDESGRIIGGMLSTLCWNWIEVEILWIEDSLRGHGYGTQLLNQIEQIAKEKGCTFIKLNTFSFQAPQFYCKNGYEEVAVFKEAPTGSNHYYFKKAIM